MYLQIFQCRETSQQSAIFICDFGRRFTDGRVGEAPEVGEPWQSIDEINVEFVRDLEIQTGAPRRDVQEPI